MILRLQLIVLITRLLTTFLDCPKPLKIRVSAVYKVQSKLEEELSRKAKNLTASLVQWLAICGCQQSELRPRKQISRSGAKCTAGRQLSG